MILNRVRGLNLMHWLAQSVTVLVLFWVSVFLFFGLVQHDPFLSRSYFVYSLIIATACLLHLGRSRTLKQDLLHLNIVHNHRLSLGHTLVILGTLFFYLVAFKDQIISRAFLFTFAVGVYGTLLLTNAIYPKLLARFFFSGNHQARTLLLGSSRDALKLMPWLERKAYYGFLPVGLVSDEQATGKHCDLPVLGQFDNVDELLRRELVTQLIVLGLPLSPNQITRLGNLCDKHGVRLFFVNDLEDKIHRSITFFQDDGFNFVGFRQEPLECPVSRVVKRAFDILISVPVILFILPPISVIVWLCHRTQSPGPLFFFQVRTGKHNRRFTIFKFRTMHVGNFDEARQATQGDPRVFSSGYWLRKLSIDELPQFINVFRGEMSVVGPRPHLVDHDVVFGEIAHYYRVRSFIKPGITGLAQVRGLRGEARQEKDLLDRIRSDIYYLENWSLVLDWTIIARTAWQMIAPSKAAY